MITPKEAEQSIGRKVVYRPVGVAPEEGVITGVSTTGWIFVRYGNDVHSKATHYHDLEFMAGGVSA